MAPYIFGVRNGVHILDLTQTVPMLHRAMMALRDVAASGGLVLFVGTKRQAQEPVAAAAKRCGQYFVNHRWLGGMLTNWKTISQSIKRLRELEVQLADPAVQQGFTKKELLQLSAASARSSSGRWRHQGHGRPAGDPVRDRHEQGGDRGPGGDQARPAGGGRPGQQLQPEEHPLPVSRDDDASRAINLDCDLAVAAVLDGVAGRDVGLGIYVGAITDLDEIEELPEGVEVPLTEGEICGHGLSSIAREQDETGLSMADITRPWSRSCASAPAPA